MLLQFEYHACLRLTAIALVPEAYPDDTAADIFVVHTKYDTNIELELVEVMKYKSLHKHLHDDELRFVLC